MDNLNSGQRMLASNAMKVEANKGNKDSLRLISELARRMEDPAQIEAFMQDPFKVYSNPQVSVISPWDPTALADGYPGILILFAALQQNGLLAKNEEKVIHHYVLKLKESIEGAKKLDLSLFSGITGICFAIKYAMTFSENRYDRLLNTLHAFLLSHVENIYLKPLRESIDQHRSCLSVHYDLIQGICGVGRYALSNLADPLFVALSQKIAETLVILCKPLHIEGRTVPGWHVAQDDILNRNSSFASLNGNFNLGLAHGVSGILAILSISTLKGIVVEGQIETIKDIASWISKRSFRDEKDTIRWSYSISWEEEIAENTLISKAPCQDAWCYGVPGVARSLFLAGRAIEDKALKDFAAQAFMGVFKRTRNEWELPGPSICHGIAGLLLLTHAMCQEVECMDLIPQLGRLQEILLSYYDPNNSLGFKDVEYDSQGEHILINRPGLLVGTAGILLTLLTVSTSSSEWHLPFLTHV